MRYEKKRFSIKLCIRTPIKTESLCLLHHHTDLIRECTNPYTHVYSKRLLTDKCARMSQLQSARAPCSTEFRQWRRDHIRITQCRTTTVSASRSTTPPPSSNSARTKRLNRLAVAARRHPRLEEHTRLCIPLAPRVERELIS